MKRIIDTAETVETTKLKRPLKFSEAPTGRTSQALCKAAAYLRARNQNRKSRRFHRIRLDGAPPFVGSFRSCDVRADQQDEVRNQLSLIWGVEPLCHEAGTTTEAMLKDGEATLLKPKRSKTAKRL
jgi:hypothetical protein